MEYKGFEIEVVEGGYRVSFDYPIYFICSTIVEAKRTINDWYAGEAYTEGR